MQLLASPLVPETGLVMVKALLWVLGLDLVPASQSGSALAPPNSADNQVSTHLCL